MSALVLAFSPVANATAMALFRGNEPFRAQVVPHPELVRGRRVDQRGVRARALRTFLDGAGIVRGGLAAVAVRGGVLRPIEGGTYRVTKELLRDADRIGAGLPANLGATLANTIAAEWSCQAFVVDPESVDERETLARLAQPCCGEPPLAPALAMRAVARRHARALRRPVEELRLVAVHLGAEVALCAHRGGRLVDVVLPLERRHACGHVCGAAPSSGAGPSAVLDLVAALARAERGDSSSLLVLQAAAYRIAKAVGELATVLEGDVDAVLVTGAVAAAGPVVAELCRRVEWIAPVFLYRGDDELLALAEGAMRALTGEEPAKRYG
jgi:butyrate kinase